MYGPSIAAPIVATILEPNRTPTEPLPDMPIVIPEISSNILKRLPEMPGGDDLSFSNYRQQQVFEEMAAIKQATNLHKAYDRRKSCSQSKGRAAQRWRRVAKLYQKV